MWCPRLEHFVRFNPNGKVARCGHMTNPPQFDSLQDMDSSEWLKQINTKFENNIWPTECVRCQETEDLNKTSIRLNSIKLHESSTRPDYLQVGGVLDNICNSACQFCSAALSTKIGSLISSDYLRIDNSTKFQNLSLERIEHLDINGGEPSTSKNYKRLLKNLPPNLKTLRVNTNCLILLPELEEIQRQGVDVTVTVSFDGVGLVGEYVRWPIPWHSFVNNLMEYKEFNLHSLNLWTTVNTLNINDMQNIFEFVDSTGFDHSYALLQNPTELSVKFENNFTMAAKNKFINSSDSRLASLAKFLAIDCNNQDELNRFIDKQDKLRNISISNYIKIHNH